MCDARHECWSIRAPLPIAMNRLSEQYPQARDLVYKEQSRDLPRGFIGAWVLLASLVWLGSLVILALLAHHLSQPIQQLTAGLSELAAGNFAVRLKSRRDDEIGRAIEAFNDSAERLEESRDRLIYLTQLASWESLARKMAHEVKNSLTPIRLTVEEMVARQSGGADRGFLEQAKQIVVEEIESLERRVRAFSQFSAEPPVRPVELNLNAIVEDRVAFLKTGHPEVNYALRLDPVAAANRGRRRSCERDPGEPSGERGAGGGHGRQRAGGDTRSERPRGRGSSRLRTGFERAGPADTIPAHDFVQEERHGPRPFHRAQERAHFRRRHRSGGR